MCAEERGSLCLTAVAFHHGLPSLPWQKAPGRMLKKSAGFVLASLSKTVKGEIRGDHARQVVEVVKTKVEDPQQSHILLTGTKLVPFYDRIELVTVGIDTVRDALIEGIVLVVFGIDAIGIVADRECKEEETWVGVSQSRIHDG